jgi:COP9 signalosome complex subunit 1
LLLIGRTSVPLCIDALKAAVVEAKRGKDLQRYREAVECLRVAAPSEPEATFDQGWLKITDETNRAETKRLEAELKGYKNNLIKECIRVCWRGYFETLPEMSGPVHVGISACL